MLLWRQTLVDGGWMRGPPCPGWELVKREKYSQAGSLLSICFIKLFGFWIHVSNKSLSPSEWQITPESSVRKAAGPTTAAEIGSSGHTWRLLRKSQESAISPPPTPALAGFLTLSLSHLGGLGLGEKLLGRLTSTSGSLLLSLRVPLKCYLWSLLTSPTPSSFPLKFEVSVFKPRVPAYSNQYRFPVTPLSQGKNWMCVLQTLGFIVRGRFTGEVTWRLLGKHCCQKKEENGFGL